MPLFHKASRKLIFYKRDAEISSDVEFLVTKYIRLFILTEPLIATQGWPSGLGRVMDLLDVSASWQERKHTRSSSEQDIVIDWRPAVRDTRGARRLANPLRTRPSILYKPIKIRRPQTFLGGSQGAIAATRWGDAWSGPLDHIQQRMGVEAGQIMVFEGERRRWGSWWVLPPDECYQSWRTTLLKITQDLAH